MEDIRDFLQQAAAPYGLKVNGAQADAFQLYYELLAEWNQKMNLTRIIEPRDVAILHFLDSLLPLQYLSLKPGATLIDVGTGAGFPGVPMKLFHPELRLTLLDSLQKRLTFLKELCAELGVSARLVHARAEEGARLPALRTGFDVATARAVASLPVLCEYCLPFLNMGGAFLAMKGPQLAEELPDAANAIALLGCEVECAEHYELPGGEQRALAVIRRVKPLDPAYPRHGSKIKQQSL